MSTEPIFAAFIVCRRSDGRIAATTRRDGKSLGLPGGKVESSDCHPMDAAYREAEEEGWGAILAGRVYGTYRAKVDGRLVVWYLHELNGLKPLKKYKERGSGIRPRWVKRSALVGVGNPEALASLLGETR